MNTLQQYRPDILQIAGRHGAKKIRVFGSFSTGGACATSDLDLLINLEKGRDLLDLIAFKQELEEQICRKVDVVTEKGLSPHLREAILAQARPL
jgi:predicted nucleotidyltransferase